MWPRCHQGHLNQNQPPGDVTRVSVRTMTSCDKDATCRKLLNSIHRATRPSLVAVGAWVYVSCQVGKFFGWKDCLPEHVGGALEDRITADALAAMNDAREAIMFELNLQSGACGPCGLGFQQFLSQL